jgi:beta-aspartyl-peptidase (threonine type)
MLTGEGAESFARTQNLEQVEPSFFFTERRWRQLEDNLRREGLPVPPRPQGAPAPIAANAPVDGEHLFGTVGAVAIDSNGDIAAATSTGGTTAKRWGRVGDTPVIGAGTYAQNGVCGVSATGTGEYFIRIGVARRICDLVELEGLSAQAAADRVVQVELREISGDGGVIAIGPDGLAAWSLNTPGMYRARLTEGGAPEVRIFAAEDEAGR